MTTVYQLALFGSIVGLVSCGGSGSPEEGLTAMGGLEDRLNQSYGYQINDKGSWVPKVDKRSQYEGRGSSGYFSGDISKNTFSTNVFNKSSWMGGQEISRTMSGYNGSGNSIGKSNHYSNQQASHEHRLQAPTRIDGNHLPGHQANESFGDQAAKPSDAETDARRRVFSQPDIIDYRQQREMNIRQSRSLLGRDE